MQFLVQHISGYFWADKHFTDFASFATLYTEAEADRVIAGDPAYRRKLRVQPVGSYSPVTESVERFAA